MHEIFGPYQLIERLASGGMAEIFKARTFGHSGFEKILAIKRLHPRCTQTPEFVEMLKEEAKTAVGLSHANIVQIFDLGRVQEHYYIAMEYINGRDLRQLVARLKDQRAFIPPEAALYLISELCSGLDFAHRQRDANGRLLRLIHRDVSPHNVMVSNEGEVKIVDFGIAKSLASHQETEAGVIKGKFCFMSPEQAQGQRLDHRTDIFSAGIILYEMLTGRSMYDTDDDHQLLRIVRNAEYTPIETLRPDLPRAVHKVINKALASHRDERYPSARHFQHAIEKVMQRSGLMFSRFQLGQLLVSYFPELKNQYEQVIDNYDDFGHDDLSLISDYDAPRPAEGDWEVPEFTDELDELDYLEELEEDERTDPNVVNPLIQAQGLPESLARKATPVPVDSQRFGQRPSGSFAPAAPPSPNAYDPVYPPHGSQQQAPVSTSMSHGQVTQPPRGHQVDKNSLHSSEVPSINPLDSGLYEPRSEHAKFNHSFGGDVDSTMLLDDKKPSRANPSTSDARSSLHQTDSHFAAYGRRERKVQGDQESWAHKVRQWIKGVKGHPHIRYLMIGLGFILLVLIGKLGKMTIADDSQSADTMVSTQIASITSEKQSTQDRPSQRQKSRRQIPRITNPAVSQPRQTYPPNVVTSRKPLNRLNKPTLSVTETTDLETPISVHIISDPPGAEVAIDGEWQPGVTPLVAQLTLGKSRILTFSMSGYIEKRTEVWPKRNRPKIEVKLSPQLGRVIIRSVPSGALIRQRGRLIGEILFECGDWPLTPNKFDLELSKSGFKKKRVEPNWLNADRGVLDVNVVLEAEERRVSRPKRKRRRARRPRQVSRPKGHGFISVKSRQWGELLVDNRSVKRGKVILRHKVSAGRHRVKFCFNADRGNCAQKVISISANDHKKVFF
jgi:serine/threonine protein kinase